MTIDVIFAESDQDFDPRFGEIQTASDGGYERGYEAGYADGSASVKDYSPDLINGTLVQYESEDVISVKEYTFNRSLLLERVSLPNCTSVGTSSFQSCSKLYDINLPKCESIGTTAFGWCSSITKIHLPSVMDIANRGLYYCQKVGTVIISQSNVVCSLGNIDAFKGTPIEKGTGYIYVPDNLVDQYKSAANWSTYATQIKPISELP